MQVLKLNNYFNSRKFVFFLEQRGFFFFPFFFLDFSILSFFHKLVFENTKKNGGWIIFFNFLKKHFYLSYNSFYNLCYIDFPLVCNNLVFFFVFLLRDYFFGFSDFKLVFSSSFFYFFCCHNISFDYYRFNLFLFLLDMHIIYYLKIVIKRFIRVLICLYFGLHSNSLLSFVRYFLNLIISRRFFIDFIFLKRVFLRYMYSYFFYRYYKKSFFKKYKKFFLTKVKDICVRIFYFFKLVFFFPVVFSFQWRLNFFRMRVFNGLKSSFEKIKVCLSALFFDFSFNFLTFLSGNIRNLGVNVFFFWRRCWKQRSSRFRGFKSYRKMKFWMYKKVFLNRSKKFYFNVFIKKISLFMSKSKYFEFLKTWFFFKVFNLRILFFFFLFFFFKMFDLFFFRLLNLYFLFWIGFLHNFLFNKYVNFFKFSLRDAFFWNGKCISFYAGYIYFFYFVRGFFFSFEGVCIYDYRRFKSFFSVITLLSNFYFFKSLFYRKRGFWQVMPTLDHTNVSKT